MKLLFSRIIVLVEDKLSTFFKIDFMKRYGYLEAGPSDSEALYDDEAIEKALRKVQRFGALEQTGRLDEQTMQVKVQFWP